MNQREIIVDSFAGGGGASTGIEMALGVSPDIAINHDAEALSMHAANHPATLHLPHNVWKVDPIAVTGGRPVGLLWASPDCKHFSKAKGGKPVSRNIRDLAWVVVRWARQVRPRVILLENVEEFQTWGPILEDGMPCPDRKGETFRRWTGELKRLGYKVEWRELRACDFGAPTIRKRLFLIARRDGRPIVWPVPTHGDPSSEAVASGRLKPWRTAAEIIDWSLPCPSIFLTPEEARAIGCKRPLADATMARIAKGVQRYVIDAAKPFIVRTDMTSAFRRNGVHGVDEPIRTQTTGGSFAVVAPFTAPLTHQGGDRGHSLEEPMRTVTAAHRGEEALIAPVMTYAQQGSAVRSAEDPLHTVTASPKDQNCVIAPYLVPRYGERAGQAPRTLPADAPIATIVPDGNQGSLAAVHLSRQFGASVGSDASEPVGTIMPGGGGKTALVSAFLAQHNSERNQGVKAGHDTREPFRTVTASGSQIGLVAAFLAQNNYTEPGHDAREPVSTIVAKGSTQAVVAANLSHLYSSSPSGGEGSPEKPIKTISTGGHAASVYSFLAKYYGDASNGQSVDEPMHTATTKDRFGLVTVEVDGVLHVITDIGLRMLTPRELFRAQGFPDGYIIDRGADDRPLTKTAQNRMCGNSVCPPLAAALVRANFAVEEVAGPEVDPDDALPLWREAAE